MITKVFFCNGKNGFCFNEYFCDHCEHLHGKGSGGEYNEIETFIVRHGTWEQVDGSPFYFKCSVCGVVKDDNSRYCPRCGSKMFEE